MVRPMRSYARFAPHAGGSAWLAVRRPALLALVIGLSLAMASTREADAITVISVALYWSVVPAVQWVAAFVLIRSAANRAAPIAGALDLCFIANGPWLIWLVGFAGWAALPAPLARSMWPILTAALIPMAWTPILVFSFCRAVLNDARPAALRRTVVHQAAIWGIFFVAWSNAVQFWPRVIAWSR